MQIAHQWLTAPQAYATHLGIHDRKKTAIGYARTHSQRMNRRRHHPALPPSPPPSARPPPPPRATTQGTTAPQAPIQQPPSNTNHSMPQRTMAKSITTWRASLPSGASMTGAMVKIGAHMGFALPRRAPAASSASARKTSTSARNWESVSWQGVPLPPPPPPSLPSPPSFLPPVLGSTHQHTLQQATATTLVGCSAACARLPRLSNCRTTHAACAHSDGGDSHPTPHTKG